MDNLFCENNKNPKEDLFSQYNHLNHHHFYNSIIKCYNIKNKTGLKLAKDNNIK